LGSIWPVSLPAAGDEHRKMGEAGKPMNFAYDALMTALRLTVQELAACQNENPNPAMLHILSSCQNPFPMNIIWHPVILPEKRSGSQLFRT